jgi:hypothetical protein
MSLSRVEQSLILAAYSRGNHPDQVHWSSCCDQVVTLSLFYTGDITPDECARRFSHKSYVAALYDDDGELTAEIRSRYEDLITLLQSHPDLIQGGGDPQLPADPTYTAGRLTAEGDRLIPSLIGAFPKKPEFPHWPDKRVFADPIFEATKAESAPMKPFPKSDNSLLIRTDFSDDAAWEALCEASVEPDEEEGFQAHLDFISDRAYEGLTIEQLVAMCPKGGSHTYMFLADGRAQSDPEQPILVVDLYTEPGRSFRVIPREMWGVENNLSIANMDFEEFADCVDADGIFRGFPIN